MNFRIISFTTVLFILSVLLIGCSSSNETTIKRTKKIEREARKPALKPNHEIERELIKNAKIKSIDKISFDYDDNGKLINGEKLSTIDFIPDGLMDETIIYGNNSRIDNIYKYNYDKKNFRIQTIRYSPDNKPDKKYLYYYNDFGNKVKSVRYDLNGNLEKYYLYKYDDNQRMVEEDWFDADGKTEYKVKYEYFDNSKKKSATTYNGDGEMLYRYEFRYDPNGNILEEKRFNEDDEPVGIIQYVYKYFGG